MTVKKWMLVVGAPVLLGGALGLLVWRRLHGSDESGYNYT